MEALEFLKERGRLCSNYKNCGSCPTVSASGLGFMLHHAHEENPECPIASYECDGGILGGVHIYDTEEQATEAWNRMADHG